MSKDGDDTLHLEGQVQDGDALETALVKINVTRTVLDNFRKQAKEAPTPKAGDKAGYEAVKRLRLDMVPVRTTTVKVLKAMREDAVAFQKKVIAKEKEITEDIAESEAILQAKEDAYLAELKAIQDEKDRIEQERVDGLLLQLQSVEWSGNPFEVAQDTPEQFAERLAKAQENFRLIQAGRKAEEERLEREEQERQAREAAIKAEEERQAKVRQEQEEAATKLRAEQEAFEKRQREAQEAAGRAERERLAKIAEEERQARQKAEAETLRLKAEADAKAKAEEDAKAAEAERSRLAAMAPDIEKAKAWAQTVRGTITEISLKDGVINDAVAKAQYEILDTLKRMEVKLQ